MRRLLFVGLFALCAIVSSAGRPVHAADAICYNCPPEWADWGSVLKAFKAETGIEVPIDNKNSGQAFVATDRREGEPGGGRHLPRRHLRHQSRERRA